MILSPNVTPSGFSNRLARLASDTTAIAHDKHACGALMPVSHTKKIVDVEFADVAALKSNEAYKTLRAEWVKARYFGKRNTADEE